MHLTTYQTAAVFLEKAQAYLEKDETRASLMLGTCLMLKARPEPPKIRSYLATVEDAQGLALAVMMTPPFNLAVFSQLLIPAAGVLEPLIANLQAQAVSVPGVVGPAPYSKTFAELWSAATGQKYRLKVSMRLFQLEKVIPPPPTPGQLRQATEADLELVARWAVAFQEEALEEQANLEQMRQGAKARIAAGAIYLWEDGEVVSMAGVSRPTVNTITVNSVYTPPEFRGKGYASQCVAGMSQRMLDKGYQACVLFTDLANPTSNSIYQKMGYRPVADFDQYHFYTSN
jgi:predicted GNAT family acetyltransferase